MTDLTLLVYHLYRLVHCHKNANEPNLPQVQPRKTKNNSKIGSGIPRSQSKIHPIFPSVELRITILLADSSCQLAVTRPVASPVRLFLPGRLRAKTHIQQIPTYNETEIKSRIDKLRCFNFVEDVINF